MARVTINRPHNFNAYSTPALQELAAAFRGRIVGRQHCGGRLYTSKGHNAFCTGGDVKEYQKQLHAEAARLLEVYVVLQVVHRGDHELFEAGHRPDSTAWPSVVATKANLRAT